MNTKNKILIALLVLSTTILACGVSLNLPEGAITIIDLINEPINVPIPNPGETSEVVISFGAGKLFINPSTDQALISGSAIYNVDTLKPEISLSGNKIIFEQGTVEYDIIGLPNFYEVENTWDLKISNSPIILEIRTWAFIDGEFEFGGMALEELRLYGGASTIKAHFSIPNQTTMTTLRLITGVANVELNGLANANFSLMDFEGGAGNYTLDFSGTMQRDATIDINAFASRIVIRVPTGVPATIQLGSEETSVKFSGSWSGEGAAYSQPGEGPSLVFKIDLGAGQLTLEN